MKFGIDRLIAEPALRAPLMGKRVALLAHPASVTENLTHTLDALAAHSAISRSAATAAKAVLSLLAHSPDDGGPPDVEVPLTLQYRTLSMRQVPLVRLPELDWP